MSDADLKILQVGVPKSGNFWLYNVIREILKIWEVQCRSFIRSHPIYKEAKNWDLSNDQQAGIDMMDIEPGRCFYRISSVVRNPIYYLPDYIRRTTQVWSHSEVCDGISEVLKAFKKIVYIYRDPRDVALSAAKFAFTPYMKKYYPHSYSSEREYLEKNFRKIVHDWKWHVMDYLLLKEDHDIHVVAYENLLNDFQTQVKDLSAYLELPLNNNGILEIYKTVNFNEMKVQNPDHVRRGKSLQWIDKLTDKQKDIAVEEAGDLLNLLGYPLTESDTWKETVDANQLQVEEIKQLEEEVKYASVEV